MKKVPPETYPHKTLKGGVVQPVPDWRCDHCRVHPNTVRVIWQATPTGRHNESYLCGSCMEKLSKWVTINEVFPLDQD
jgi:predicted SprT family Zn-dependent metalloprotease